mmetsp:Transcript_9311/g.21163  ORF Transcript_9311/g.21163 Transcript_9311/m.21163 type:complete len:200 (-) Transcript_9311:476-1075(-)
MCHAYTSIRLISFTMPLSRTFHTDASPTAASPHTFMRCECVSLRHLHSAVLPRLPSVWIATRTSTLLVGKFRSFRACSHHPPHCASRFREANITASTASTCVAPCLLCRSARTSAGATFVCAGMVRSAASDASTRARYVSDTLSGVFSSTLDWCTSNALHQSPGRVSPPPTPTTCLSTTSSAASNAPLTSEVCDAASAR